MLARLREDVAAVLERDPAAKSSVEVLTCYAGLHAVWAHVAIHRLWEGGFHLTARLLSQFVRFMTGVEIHPGAELGRRVVIDHGMGVVIGETAEVGDDVHMYHGVTLGGNSPDPEKRHPTLGDGVVVGANATLLGDIRVGDDARVGAGSVLTKDVPAGETWAGVPAVHVAGGESEDVSDDGAEDAETGEVGTVDDDSPAEPSPADGTEVEADD
ncbi:serine O-acetyltransferase [Haloarchaeobius iranensis]|uniref:Serine acetyltransferase n=1 Tax=Haloarchaeobius iranensis TaxID=996166 RepID=A0A1G9Z518_9EURY|nr:serine O-acetyltransferase [Haloarchaeobius iranensis]SDN16384.1 serine O-acetyltransferase [Haloarchaeobius iranensis]